MQRPGRPTFGKLKPSESQVRKSNEVANNAMNTGRSVEMQAEIEMRASRDRAKETNAVKKRNSN